MKHCWYDLVTTTKHKVDEAAGEVKAETVTAAHQAQAKVQELGHDAQGMLIDDLLVRNPFSFSKSNSVRTCRRR